MFERKNQRWMQAGVAGFAVLALSAAGCSSSTPNAESSADSGLATLDTGDVVDENRAPAGESAASSDGELSEAELTRVIEDWRDCMIEGGVPADTITAEIDDDGFPNLGTEFDEGDNIAEDVLQEAEATCEAVLEPLFAQFVGDAEAVAERADKSRAAKDCLDAAQIEGLTVSVDEATGFLNEEFNAASPEAEALLEETAERCFSEAGLEQPR